jgi:hypothetical protein
MTPSAVLPPPAQTIGLIGTALAPLRSDIVTAAAEELAS